MLYVLGDRYSPPVWIKKKRTRCLLSLTVALVMLLLSDLLLTLSLCSAHVSPCCPLGYTTTFNMSTVLETETSKTHKDKTIQEKLIIPVTTLYMVSQYGPLMHFNKKRSPMSLKISRGRLSEFLVSLCLWREVFPSFDISSWVEQSTVEWSVG